MLKNKVKRFCDFAQEEGPLDGDKVQIDLVLNQEIVVTGYKIKRSKYSGKNVSGKYLTVQFMYPERDQKRVFFTGSDVLISQIEKYASEIPFLTVVKKIDRYYTFT